MPVREAVALFEDVARQPVSTFFVPTGAYFRPLFYAALSALWYQAGSLPAILAGVTLLHIVPVVALVGLFIWHLGPRTFADASVAAVAVAVLVGSRGFRDNLEIPLSYTIVGMPLALAAWMMLERDRRRWHAPLIVALTVVAIGFKEQGLVIVPLVVAAWWARAPGATGRLALTLSLLTLAYLGIRLALRESWAPFEQAVGLGFTEIEPAEAAARFGAFPYWMYAYTGASTIGNVLFSEPTRGVFRIVQDVSAGRPEIWEMLQLLSSTGVTATIAWWGVRSLRDGGRTTPDSRLFLALLVVLLASGALSFNYSRDRLGGMAAVFYAVAAYFALRAAAARALSAPRPVFVAATLGLALLAAGWHSRAISTLEIARIFAARNELEWLVMIPDRRIEFASRPVYLEIMQSMVEQGTAPGHARPTSYPPLVKRTLGLP